MTELSKRVPAGRLNGITAEVGTILGPKEVTREYVVVTATDGQSVEVGYATEADLAAAVERRLDPQTGRFVFVREPRSVTEIALRSGA